MMRFVNMNKTELFIQRVKAFEDEKLRDSVWNKMDKKTQSIVNKIIKKRLDSYSKRVVTYQ